MMVSLASKLPRNSQERFLHEMKPIDSATEKCNGSIL